MHSIAQEMQKSSGGVSDQVSGYEARVAAQSHVFLVLAHLGRKEDFALSSPRQARLRRARNDNGNGLRIPVRGVKEMHRSFASLRMTE